MTAKVELNGDAVPMNPPFARVTTSKQAFDNAVVQPADLAAAIHCWLCSVGGLTDTKTEEVTVVAPCFLH